MAKILGMITAIIVMVAGLGLLLSLPVMWLWNGCLVDAVDGVHEITWLQAWGISVLTSWLFKSHDSK